MTTIVLIRPERDFTEEVLSEWADEFLRTIAGSGDLEIIDLRGPVVTDGSSVHEAIGRADVVAYFGHGGPSNWGGPPLEELIWESDIVSSPAGRIAAIACYSARELGRAAVERGSAREFVGFVEPLLIVERRRSVFSRQVAAALRVLVAGAGGRSAPTLREQFEVQEHLHEPGGLLHQDLDGSLIWMSALSNRQAVRGYPEDL